MASNLEGHFTITYPQWIPFLNTASREQVGGAQLFEKIQRYVDSIPRWAVALSSVVSDSVGTERMELRIDSAQDNRDYTLIFGTRKFGIHARVSANEVESFIQFFGPQSSCAYLGTELIRRQRVANLHSSAALLNMPVLYLDNFNLTGPMHLSLKTRVLDISSVFNLNKVQFFKNIVRYTPNCQSLALTLSDALSLDQLKECLFSIGAVRTLTLEINQPLDCNILREARFGNLEKLTIHGTEPGPSVDEMEKALLAVPTLKTFTYFNPGVDDTTIQSKKGFQYKEDRLQPVEGTLNDELTKVEQSKTAVFTHLPNLDTFDGAHFENLFSHPAFQSVKVLRITGDLSDL